MNPAVSIKAEDQLKSLATIKDLSANGSLYSMEYACDHRLDDIIASNCRSFEEFIAAAKKHLFTGHMDVPGFGACCSAFIARDKRGHVLVGRNFDFTHELCSILLKTENPAYQKTIGLADMAFAQMKPGMFSDGKSDISIATAAPYFTMDGMNEKGVFVCVLQLNGAETHQDTGKHKALNTVIMRAVLDRAQSVGDAVGIFSSSDIQVPFENTDYHYFVADASGDSCLIEYVNNEMNVIKTDLVTNFFLSKGMRRKGQGKARYAVIEDVLHYREGHLEKKEVMNLLRLVSQPAGQHGSGNTLWSAVYDLTAKELTVVMGRRWSEEKHFML